MRILFLFIVFLSTLVAHAETPAGALWGELKAKREKLPGVHQEYEVTRTLKTAKGSQSSTGQLVIDMSQGRWRESSVSGSGNHIMIFDTQDIVVTEDGGDEFVRTKRHPKEEAPSPAPYSSGNPEWAKTAELHRLPCGLLGREDQCVLLEV